MKNHIQLAAGLACLLTGDYSFSQAPSASAASSDRVLYEAAFYDAFAPRTALDMIEQTPGFVLDAPEDSSEVRGFSGAVGNVLIDGQRLGAKSQSLRDVLGRVGAREVLRIEVLRGAAVAGDASGASVLANVVRTPVAGGGTWQAGFEYANAHTFKPSGSFGWSGRKESTEYSVGANVYTHDHTNAGWFDITDGDGALIARRRDDIPHANDDYSLNGQVSFPVSVGRLTLTGQIKYFEHEEQFSQLLTTPAGVRSEFEYFPFGERVRTGEAGATWQRPVGGWDMNVTALGTRKFTRWDGLAESFDALDVLQQVYSQEGRNDSGETIVRGTFARPLEKGRLEFGAEGAINTLDSESDLTLDTGAGPLPVDIANANLSVEETRGEAFVSHAWHFTERWSLDSRLAMETSRLSFTGDTEQSVSLTYVKPRLQLTRQLGRHQLQMRVFRDVGQLDFNDFVSTAQFADEIIEGGNPDLRPQTAWAVEAEADVRFAGDGAFRLRLFKHFVDDVVDFVPVGEPGEQFDAPGNIGEGGILGAEVSLRVPLNRMLRGGTFAVTGHWQDTEVEDPLTQRQRPFSDFSENHLNAELRQDFTAARFAWGTSYNAYSMDTDFRLNEINRFREIQQLNVFVETTWFANLKIRLEGQSLLNSAEKRDRRLYFPDRNGGLLRRERGEYQPGHWWQFSISSSF
jgi:hypothetical protein